MRAPSLETLSLQRGAQAHTHKIKNGSDCRSMHIHPPIHTPTHTGGKKRERKSERQPSRRSVRNNASDPCTYHTRRAHTRANLYIPTRTGAYGVQELRAECRPLLGGCIAFFFCLLDCPIGRQEKTVHVANQWPSGRPSAAVESEEGKERRSEGRA